MILIVSSLSNFDVYSRALFAVDGVVGVNNEDKYVVNVLNHQQYAGNVI